MRTQLFLAAVAAMALGACVGGVDEPTDGVPSDDLPEDDTPVDPAETARQMFDRTVYNHVLSCDGAGCHTGGDLTTVNTFLGELDADKDSYYTALTADRGVVGGFDAAAATILTKGAHSGPAWQPNQATDITNWLNKELEERGGVEPVPVADPRKTSRGALQQWASCIGASLEEYEATQAYTVANMNSNNGRCYSCHNGGAAGTLLMQPNDQADRLAMLGFWQEERFVSGIFATKLGPDNRYSVLAAREKFCAKGEEKNNNLGTHPEFNCNQQGLTNLENFVTQVQLKVEAGTCPTPGMFRDPQPL